MLQTGISEVIDSNCLALYVRDVGNGIKERNLWDRVSSSKDGGGLYGSFIYLFIFFLPWYVHCNKIDKILQARMATRLFRRQEA